MHDAADSVRRRLDAARDTALKPTPEGARAAWLAINGPVHAPSLAGRPVPPRRWLVADLIPMGSASLLSGDGGSGKSTLALQLAAAMVTQNQWLGRDTLPGKAAYVSCEDDLDELHRRLAGICDGERWRIADLVGLELFDRVGRDSAIITRGQGFGTWEETPWWCSFSNWVRDTGPGLVILDSLYDFFGTGSQLDMGIVRLFMGKLRELANDAGCAILVLWHPSKSGIESGDGTSGNVAFRNAARAMLYLERDRENEDPDAPLLLRSKKSNYGPAADEIRIRWELGRFVPVVAQGSPSGMVGVIHQRNAETAFLECLDAAMKQQRYVSPNRGMSWAPSILGRMKQAAGFKVRDLERAMESLLAAGTIEVGEVGRYANRSPRLGLRRTPRTEGADHA